MQSNRSKDLYTLSQSTLEPHVVARYLIAAQGHNFAAKVLTERSIDISPKVQNFLQEEIAYELEDWNFYCALLQERVADWDSKIAKEDAEEKIEWVMLEHLAELDTTLQYFKTKAHRNVFVKTID